MFDRTQWYKDGECVWCGAPRYVNEDLGKVYWKDDGFDCFHQTEQEDAGEDSGEPRMSGMEDYLGIKDR